MHKTNIDIGSKTDAARLYVIADAHIGDPALDVQALKAVITAAKDDPRGYVILNGDLISNATRTSVSDIYSEVLSPMEQMRIAVDMLTPIKDKIIAVCAGNHEDRTYRKEGIDINALIARELGAESKYSPTSAVVFLRMGDAGGKEHNRRITYSIYCAHGSVCGRKEGAKAIRLADLASIIDADIYIHSHTHMPMVMRQGFYRTSINDSGVNMVDKLFVNSSSFCNYAGYADNMQFKPSSKTNPVIHLDGTRHFAQAYI
jgi:predicted phosphodiesterase